jgi:hypothetical protein
MSNQDDDTEEAKSDEKKSEMPHLHVKTSKSAPEFSANRDICATTRIFWRIAALIVAKKQQPPCWRPRWTNVRRS